MQFLRLSTIITLAVSAIAVSALLSSNDAPSSSDLDLIKRGKPCESGYTRYHGQGNCHKIGPAYYGSCEQVCIAGRNIGAGIRSTCGQQNRKQYPPAGPTAQVTQEGNTKRFTITGNEADVPTQEFYGSVDNGDTLTLGIKTAADYVKWQDEMDLKMRHYFFEVVVGEWTYYYKVNGLAACQTPGPQATNLYSELSKVTVLKECWTKDRHNGFCPFTG